MADRLPNVHPGEVLREDYLIPLGRSASWLAKGLGMSQSAVAEILSGKRSITPATALRLSRFLGTSAELWLDLQADYDLEEARNRLADVLDKIQPCDLLPAALAGGRSPLIPQNQLARSQSRSPGRPGGHAGGRASHSRECKRVGEASIRRGGGPTRRRRRGA